MEERMLTMRVEGEAIAQIAREQCYYSRKFDSAMNILIASLQNEELEEGEIAGIALSILDGRAEIKGTYPDGDYRLEYLEVQDEKWKLGNLIDKIARELEQQKKEKQTLLKKYLFVSDSLEAVSYTHLDVYKRQGRTLHPDNMAAGPASYGMTDTLGRMHSDAQFAGSSSVPAHVEMMGLIGAGNNPMVGMTVAVAVSIEEAAQAGKF